MITMKPGNYINEYYGLTTDTKPTDPYLPNASIFYEMDTGDIYLYDAANGEWVLQPSSDGGGGGGGSVETDKTLTRDGVPADAKAAGDRINVVKAALAPEFDEDEYYSARTAVWHNGVLYVILDEHDSGVSWEDIEVYPTAIGEELQYIGEELQDIWGAIEDPAIYNQLRDITGKIAPYFEVNETYDAGAYVWYGTGLYILYDGHTSGTSWEQTWKNPINLSQELNRIIPAIKDMIATTESAATASRSYAAGEYVIVNDMLYKTTRAIAVNEVLSEGYNIAPTNIATEIAGNTGLASAIKAAIAPEFDENEYYPAGAVVWHDGNLYGIFTEHDSGVSWEDTISMAYSVRVCYAGYGGALYTTGANGSYGAAPLGILA